MNLQKALTITFTTHRKQGVEPNPNLNRELVKTAFFRWTRTEPEPFKFEIIEPEPNPNL